MFRPVLISFVCLCMSNTYALQERFSKERKFSAPRREQSIIVSDEGFYPEKMFFYVGEKVHFFVTSVTKRPSCLMLPEKKIFLAASQGKISEGEAFFDKAGVYKIYCPTGKIQGRITIKEHPDAVKKRIRRQIASEKRVKIWRPQDDMW